jgi:hypothetical protein
MGLTALWRRALAPRPSPAVERFVGWLAATPYDWDVGPDGKLRAHEREATLCAVTGVALSLTGETYSIGDWIHAADGIGLSYADAGLLVAAADGLPASRAARRLRPRLLAAAEMATRRRRAHERSPLLAHERLLMARLTGTSRARHRDAGQTEMPNTSLVSSPMA